MELSERFGWERTLYERRGGEKRLLGMWVLHDFTWRRQFGNGRGQFRGGKKLAQLVRDDCPQGKIPALLLTEDPDVDEGIWPDEEYHLFVVRIADYVSQPDADLAATYVAKLRRDRRVQTAGRRAPDEAEPKPAHNVWIPQVSVPHVLAALESEDSTRAELAAALADRDGIASLVHGRESEALIAAHDVLGDRLWEMLDAAGLRLPTALAQERVWASRAEGLAEFKRQLEARDWEESDWQRFFELETWIFGFGLNYQFLHLVEGHPYLGGKGFKGRGGSVGDFLYSTGGYLRFTVLVEIKKPQSDLLEERTYRTKVYAPSPDLVGGVAQIQRQAWEWSMESTRDSSRDELEQRSVFTHQPRGILVTGHTAEFERGGQPDRARLYSFESYRRNLALPEVLTFDEVYARAEQMLSPHEPP